MIKSVLYILFLTTRLFYNIYFTDLFINNHNVISYQILQFFSSIVYNRLLLYLDYFVINLDFTRLQDFKISVPKPSTLVLVDMRSPVTPLSPLSGSFSFYVVHSFSLDGSAHCHPTRFLRDTDSEDRCVKTPITENFLFDSDSMDETWVL